MVLRVLKHTACLNKVLIAVYVIGFTVKLLENI